MFIMHISLLFAYSVLMASTVLLVWNMRNKGEGSSLAKFVGSLVFVLALFSILCISFYGIKYWGQGHFETPMTMTTTMGK